MQIRIKKIRLSSRQAGEIAVIILSVLLFVWSAYLSFSPTSFEEHKLLNTLIQKKGQGGVMQIDAQVLRSDSWMRLLPIAAPDTGSVEMGRANPFLPPAEEVSGEGGENRQ